MQANRDGFRVVLPYSTDVVVKGFANAFRIQRITVQPPVGGPVTFQGAGEQNTPIGSTHFTTPSGGPVPTVGIVIEYSKDGGKSWNPSDIATDSCSVHAYRLFVVVSEDEVDQDYNDAVCMISWPERTGP